MAPEGDGVASVIEVEGRQLLSLALLGEGACRGRLGSCAGATVPQDFACGCGCFTAGLFGVLWHFIVLARLFWDFWADSVE